MKFQHGLKLCVTKVSLLLHYPLLTLTFDFMNIIVLCVKLHQRFETDEKKGLRPLRSFVRLFVRCVCQQRLSYGGTNRDAS